MSSSEEISSKERHILKKNKSKLISHAPLMVEKSGIEDNAKIIITNEEDIECTLEKKEMRKREILCDLNKLPENASKLIFSFLNVNSLDSTNICAVFPELTKHRSAVLTDYYASINSQYASNRSTGFLSPDHCRTPVLSKPEESLYTDVQILRSHRRLHFD